MEIRAIEYGKPNYASVKDKEPAFIIAMTSLTVEEFEMLYVYFKKAFDNYNQKRGYSPSKGGFEANVFFILAHSFNISQGQANYWIHKLSIILNKTLSDNNYMHERISEELMNCKNKLYRIY